MTMTKTRSTTTSASTNDKVIGNKKTSTIVKIKKLINEDDEITLEDLAPDGGWGWIIALAMIFIFVSIIIKNIIMFSIIFGIDKIVAYLQIMLSLKIILQSFLNINFT